jgi:hypothetical protein
LNQGARRAGADLALVEGEQHETLDGLVEEIVVGRGYVRKEDVRRLAAEFERRRNQIVGGGLRNHAARRRRTRERYFRDAPALCERQTRFPTIAVHDVEHARRQQIGDQFGDQEDADRGLFGGLEHDRIARTERGCEFPRGHEDRKVPGNDLAHDAQRFVIVIGDGRLVEIAQRAFLSAHAAREIAEVVDGEGDVGVQGFADRFAVVDGLGVGELLEILFEAVGDLQKDVGAFTGRGFAPLLGGGVRRVEREFHVLGGRARSLRVDLAADRRDHVEIRAFHGCHPLAADEIVVFRLEFDFGADGARC